jgi:hypothetical protein
MYERIRKAQLTHDTGTEPSSSKNHVDEAASSTFTQLEQCCLPAHIALGSGRKLMQRFQQAATPPRIK